MKKRLPVLWVFTGIISLVCLGLSGCPQKSAQAPAPPVATEAGPAAQLQGKLVVFVPCGIAGPYGEIKKIFEQRFPNVKVTQQIANIDVLVRMLVEGKGQADVWLALGDREMERVKKAGRIDGEPVTYAYNSLALLVHKGNPLNIESLADIAKPGVKTIALATAENSNGYYAEQALRQAGLWEKVEKKLWRTPEPAQIKEQLLQKKAEVGIVYYPCTRETHIVGGQPREVPGKLQLLGKLPEELYGRIPAQAALIQGAQNKEAAQAFLQMLREPFVQDIWEKFGFDRAVEDPQRVTLYMYCGAGIRTMMDPAIEAFQKLNPRVRIDVGYAGSGCVLSQLTFARRGDLYVPGEEFYLNQAVKRGFVATSKVVGYFEPVILVAKGNPKQIKGLADLTKPGIKIGLGEPEACAVGITAEEILKQAGLTEAVHKNVIYRAGNVPELGVAVKLRSVDAAIVWNVTAQQVLDACEIVPIDPAFYKPVQVAVAVLKFSQHQAEAKQFMEFLAGPEGQKIVAKSGMKPVAP